MWRELPQVTGKGHSGDDRDASSPLSGLCWGFRGTMSFGTWTLAPTLVLSGHPTLQLSGLLSSTKSRSHDCPAVSPGQGFTRARPPARACPALCPQLFPSQPSCQNVPYSLSLHGFPTRSLVIPSQPSLCPPHPRGSRQGLQGILPALGVRLSLLPSCFEASSQRPSGSAVIPAVPGGLLSPLHLALCSRLPPPPPAETSVHPAVALVC